MDMTRKEFLVAGLAAFGAVSVVAACGQGGSDSDDTACEESISSNHGHVLTVSQGDVTAAQDKTYDIRGRASHSHTVTLTAADFATLASGGTVTATSSLGGGHSHDVAVVCAG